jgi:hypothetical protein
MSDDLRSQHPVDRLIRDLIATKRQPSSSEIAAIVDRIATAPFDPRLRIPVLNGHRGISYQGQTLGARASALDYHLVKRVMIERQWAHGTSAVDYLSDLHEAARAPDAQLALYDRRGGSMTAVVSWNRIPHTRRGTDSLPWLLVVFSADRGTIVTGYQVSSEHPDNIPEDVPWLR